MDSVEQHLRTVISAAQDGYTDQCITIEAEADPSRWVQLTWDAINFAYPLADAPAERLGEFGIEVPDGVELTGWEPGKYVTFEHGADHLAVLARFIDSYLRQVLSLDLHIDPVTVTAEAL